MTEEAETDGMQESSSRSAGLKNEEKKKKMKQVGFEPTPTPVERESRVYQSDPLPLRYGEMLIFYENILISMR